jgi:transglutaminase-like putative cysteine protease
MAAGSIFDEEPKNGSGSKVALIAIVALVVFAGVGYGVYLYTSPPVAGPPDRALIEAVETREAYLFLLAQPSFSGDEFRQQVLGKGRVTSFAWKRKEVYFTFPETPEEEFQEFLDKYTFDKTKVTFGDPQDGKIKLDDYTLRVGPTAARLFKTSVYNVRLDTDATFSFPFTSVNYTLNPSEIRNYANNSQVYGGRMITQSSETNPEPQFLFANHGIMVAKPGEPSLMRLVDELLKDVSDNREARIQRLVDFVSNEIEYSYTEAVSGREKLKRPNQVLMTRNGDCSNKTILLASLLEQINEEYVLLYCPRHITVAVPQGNFVNENKLDFKWDQRQWMIAESTAVDFQIGQSRIQDPSILHNVQYVQNPKIRDLIYDAHSYEPLTFY